MSLIQSWHRYPQLVFWTSNVTAKILQNKEQIRIATKTVKKRTPKWVLLFLWYVYLWTDYYISDVKNSEVCQSA